MFFQRTFQRVNSFSKNTNMIYEYARPLANNNVNVVRNTLIKNAAQSITKVIYIDRQELIRLKNFCLKTAIRRFYSQR